MTNPEKDGEIDLSWYPQLPESMTKGKTAEEIEAMKDIIRGHTVKQIFREKP